MSEYKIFYRRYINETLTWTALMWSKLKMKTTECHRSNAFTVNFKHISHLFLVFLILSLNRYMFAGVHHKNLGFLFLTLKKNNCRLEFPNSAILITREESQHEFPMWFKILNKQFDCMYCENLELNTIINDHYIF